MKQFTTKEITKDLLYMSMYSFVLVKNPTIETIQQDNILDMFEEHLKERSKPNQFGCVDEISKYSLETLQHIRKYNITTMLRPRMIVAVGKGKEYTIEQCENLIEKYSMIDKVMIDGKKVDSIIPEKHDYSLIKVNF